MKKIKYHKTSARLNSSREGETIEMKIERIVNNNEPITDGAPLTYTERKDGVLPAYDIRTDRFEIAVDAIDSISRSNMAKREGLKLEKEAKIIQFKASEDGKAEPTQGTDN